MRTTTTTRRGEFSGRRTTGKGKTAREKLEDLRMIERMLGANRVKVQSTDGKTRIGSVPGKRSEFGFILKMSLLQYLGLFKTIKQASLRGTKVRKLNN